jgi:hypothetical protein
MVGAGEAINFSSIFFEFPYKKQMLPKIYTLLFESPEMFYFMNAVFIALFILCKLIH